MVKRPPSGTSKMASSPFRIPALQARRVYETQSFVSKIDIWIPSPTPPTPPPLQVEALIFNFKLSDPAMNASQTLF